jgi:hypothetical protein
VFIGDGAGIKNTTGSNNILLGKDSFRLTSTGNANIGIGTNAGDSNVSGNRNIYIGEMTGSKNDEESDNIIIGYKAGETIKGEKNIIIGSNAGSGSIAGSKNIYIGTDLLANNEDEVTRLGDSQAVIYAPNNITAQADERDIANVEELNIGISFINSLKPIKYNQDKRIWYPGGVSDGTKVRTVTDFGFTGQDTAKALSDNSIADVTGLVDNNNEDLLHMSTDQLIPIMVKALQELTIAKNEGYVRTKHPIDGIHVNATSRYRYDMGVNLYEIQGQLAITYSFVIDDRKVLTDFRIELPIKESSPYLDLGVYKYLQYMLRCNVEEAEPNILQVATGYDATTESPNDGIIESVYIYSSLAEAPTY